MKKAALFDFDGTLFNTSDINYFSYSQALKEVGAELKREYFDEKCDGRNYKEFVPALVDYDDEKVEIVHKRKQELYSENLDKVKVNEELFDIIKGLKGDYTIAIVTTASRKCVLEMLSATNKKDIFDLLVCGDDVTNYKPDPECYLLAMSKIGVKPENTIIFEDSRYGIEAGLASGASVYAVKRFN